MSVWAVKIHRNPHSPLLLGLRMKFSVSRGLVEIHSTTLNRPSKPCQINALHPSSVHMALKACSATQITDLLNYNFVGPGSALYPRHSEISLTDRAVSPDISITGRATRNRQLISRGPLQRCLSKSAFKTRRSPQTFQVLLAPLLEVCLDNEAASHVEIKIYGDACLITLISHGCRSFSSYRSAH